VFTHTNTGTTFDKSQEYSFEGPSRTDASLAIDSGFSKYAKSANWAGDNRDLSSA
jgi:hypothetical protein